MVSTYYPIIRILYVGISLLPCLIGWNSMTPPQLSGNTPVLQFSDPSVPGVFVLHWENGEIFLGHSIQHWLGDLRAVDPPLGSDDRFDHIPRSGAESNTHVIILFLLPQIQSLEILFDHFPHIKSLHSFVLPSVFINEPIVSEDVDELQVVPLPAKVIVRVVGGSNL